MRKIYVLMWCVLLSAGLSSNAWALITNTYDATKCLGLNNTDNAMLQRTNGTITNPTGGTINIFCPIVKTTSGPGIVNDQIWDAKVPVIAPAGTVVNCGIEVFQNQAFSGVQNFVESSWGQIIGSGTMNIGFQSLFSGPNDYWDGLGGTGSVPQSWYYANIACQLPGGSSIGRYSIDEVGTVQPNRIYTTSACAPDPAGPPDWRYLDFESGGEDRGGGVVFGASDGVKYIFDCPVASSTSIEFSVGPDDGLGQTLGCSLDARANPQTWPSQTVNPNTDVVQVLPLIGSPLIRIPAGGSHKLVCDSTPDTGRGDGRLDSFRTEPDWLPSASVSGGGSTPQQGIDLSMATRWTTGKPQVNGMWFEVDLRSAKSFSSIEMNSTGSNNDYAHAFQVFVSNNGSTWGNAIFTGTGTGPIIVAGFPVQTARYIRVVQTGTNSHWWSIYEFTVFK